MSSSRQRRHIKYAGCAQPQTRAKTDLPHPRLVTGVQTVLVGYLLLGWERRRTATA